MHLLTGVLPSTSGFYVVAGKHSKTQLPEIRENLGICLQHNDNLFAKLTVREILQFYCRLKGAPSDQTNIDQLLREVALDDKSESLVENLSGGMKRKLSLAIAFSGESKVIVLDEPTSGMASHILLYCTSLFLSISADLHLSDMCFSTVSQDPFSRRFIWNLIKQKRHGRIILLTTHFLVSALVLVPL